jgi:methyl-accepting chemotaxis protein
MLSQLKIGLRLAFAFGALAMLTLALSVFAIVRMGSIADAVAFQDKVRNEKLEHLYAAREALAQTGLSARNALAIADLAEATKELDKLDQFKAVYLEAIRKAAPHFQGDKQFEIVQAGLLTMAKELNRVRPLRTNATTEEFATFIANECRPLRNQIVADMDKLLKSVQADVNQASADAHRVFDVAKMSIIAAGFVVLVIAIILGGYITVSITRPLQSAVDVAETVASGDLTSCIDVKSSDETGQLQGALRKMNENLLQIIGEVRQGTDAIATGSSEIRAGNQDLSERTEQQAAALEETASSMEQLTSTVKQNAESARQANELAATASEVATRGGEVVARVVGTMDSISGSAK